MKLNGKFRMNALVGISVVLAALLGISRADEQTVQRGKGSPRACSTVGSSGLKGYATGKELLRAVNVWRERHGLPDFGYDEFCVHLASQVRYAAGNGEVNAVERDFLKELLHKKRFRIPVELAEWSEHDVAMGGAYVWDDRIPLPEYWVLDIHILFLPWGSKDESGQEMKIDWAEILVSDVLVRKAKRPREAHQKSLSS
jgi:hypothetical protein